MTYPVKKTTSTRKWKALISAPYMQPVIGEFSELFSDNDVEIVLPVVQERLGEEELLRYVGDVDGVICGDDLFSERVLKESSRLRVISKWGTGVDSIDKQAAEKLGIKVYNTPDAFSKPVADTVMSYILCFARNPILLNSNMRQRRWQKVNGISLEECTLGVIGVGNVGKQVLRRAVAFGMTILGNDVADIDDRFIAETGLQMVTKDAIFRDADFISINCDLNPSSFHLVSHSEFSSMKENATLINTARGPIVDEAALVQALKDKTIAGAALDVFETEPLPPDSPLFDYENVLLSPHNANSSPRAWEYVHENTIRNLFKGLGIENHF